MTLGTLSADMSTQIATTSDPILVAAPGPTAPGGVAPEQTNPVSGTTCPSGQAWDPYFQACIDPNAPYPPAATTPTWIPGVSNTLVLGIGGLIVLSMFMKGGK